MAIDQLKEFIELGNIRNSVNYPTCIAGPKTASLRVCINHKNISGMIAKFSTVISNDGGNIETFVNKSKGEFAYSVLDVDGVVDIDDIKAIEGVLRVRVI